MTITIYGKNKIDEKEKETAMDSEENKPGTLIVGSRDKCPEYNFDYIPDADGAEEGTLVLAPKYIVTVLPGLALEFDRQPNWFVRIWQKMLLGWVWEKI